MSEKQTIKIHGREYETVASRLRRWREKFPVPDNAYCLETRIVELTDDRVVVQALIKTPDGIIVGSGLAEEYRDTSQINKTSALENCETSAIGRALASIGFLSGEYASANEVIGAMQKQETSLQPQKSTYSQPQFNLVCKLLAEIAPQYINHDLESHTVHQLATTLLADADKNKASKVITRLKEVKEALATPQEKLTAEQEKHMGGFGEWLMGELGKMEKGK